MNKEEKLKMLQSLSEKDLTKRFLIPLYESMDCKNVRYTHRKLEFGKDIVYYKDDEYGNMVYTGVQVKKTQIKTCDVADIFRQISEAFGEPFTDLSNGKKLDLDRFVVLTSNEFSKNAKISLWASLRGASLERLVTCVDINGLIQLIDKNFPSAFRNAHQYSDNNYSAILTKFKEMLNNSDLKEEDFKQFFKRNPWLLGVGISYKDILPEQRAGSSFRVDFLLKTFEDYYDIMELKKHTDNIIIGGEKDWRISTKCENGISQLSRYIEYYERNVEQQHYEIGIDPYKPFGFIVIGRCDSRNIQRKLRAINSRYHRIKILTYDDLYDQAKRWIEFRTGRE
jgi:hypothetical protein